jgi:hypothetical protein
MATILHYIQGEAFQPHDVKAMSMALDDVCKELKLDGNAAAKETVAIRIIELARGGERSPTRLRDRVLHEAYAGADKAGRAVFSARDIPPSRLQRES